MNCLSRTLLLSVSALVLCSFPAAAQPSVLVTSIEAVRSAPEAVARVYVRCDGEPLTSMRASDLRLFENGLAVTDFSILNSPSPNVRQPFTAMLALDISGSMAGAGITGLKNAANALVQYMDTTTDRIGIVAFKETSQLLRPPTSDPDSLRSTIDGLWASGATAMYDGTYDALERLIALGDTAARSVILLSDGADNSSTRQPNELVALANQYNKRLYVIGLGTAVPTTTLQALAQLTGGLFFDSPTPSELQILFTSIASFMRRGYDEYTIRYRSVDPDALQRTVRAVVTGCGSATEGSSTRPVQPGVAYAGPLAAHADEFFVASVAPHPAAGASVTVTLHSGASYPEAGYEVVMFDHLGRHAGARQTITRSTGVQHISIPVTGLPSGWYVLRVSSGMAVRLVPLLVQR